MTRKRLVVGTLVGALLLMDGLGSAQGPRGQIDERVALDNDSVRVVLFTYHPGADSDMHLNPGPEITIVIEGELAVYTSNGREALKAGAVHWLPGSTVHLARNEGTRPVRFWSLLFKRCD